MAIGAAKHLRNCSISLADRLDVAAGGGGEALVERLDELLLADHARGDVEADRHRGVGGDDRRGVAAGLGEVQARDVHLHEVLGAGAGAVEPQVDVAGCGARRGAARGGGAGASSARPAARANRTVRMSGLDGGFAMSWD